MRAAVFVILALFCSACGRCVLNEDRNVPVQPGIEILLENPKPVIGGKRVGLLTHAAGVNRHLQSTVDSVRANPDIRLVSLFSPEHGIRGSAVAGEAVGSGRDPLTGLPVHSLYGKTKKPSPEMLSDIDLLVVDLQDIGSRSYTYISTLYYAMEAAAENGKGVVVCDRPNPMGGLVVDGPVLDTAFRSFIGIAPIPVVHGMTIGELARLFNEEYRIGCGLTVVPMRGWKRSMLFRETGLFWVPPSPHIPTPESALLYPVTGLIGEMGTLSEGVGTPMPFHLVGATWMDGRTLLRVLPDVRGVAFRPLTVKPFYFRNAGEEVHGLQIYVTDHRIYKPVETSIHLLVQIRRLWPDQFQWHPQDRPEQLRNVDSAWGTDRIRRMIDEGRPADEIIASYRPELDGFAAIRKKYLLY